MQSSARKKAGSAHARFQQLIDLKFATGLSAEEAAELDRLEADFQIEDEQFYAPIIERIAAKRK